MYCGQHHGPSAGDLDGLVNLVYYGAVRRCGQLVVSDSRANTFGGTWSSRRQKHFIKAAVSVIEVAFLERKKRRQASAVGQSVLRSFETRRSPAMYNVMRQMREARHLIRQSLGAAGDSVVDEKLKDAISLADGINKTLHEQGLAILFLQERVARAAAVVKQQATKGGQGTTGSIKDHVEKIQTRSGTCTIVMLAFIEILDTLF